MKNIIIGQALLWLNMATILAGYYIIKDLELPNGILFLFCIIGFVGSIANLVFSIAIQGKAYNKMGLTDF